MKAIDLEHHKEVIEFIQCKTYLQRCAILV